MRGQSCKKANNLDPILGRRHSCEHILSQVGNLAQKKYFGINGAWLVVRVGIEYNGRVTWLTYLALYTWNNRALLEGHKEIKKYNDRHEWAHLSAINLVQHFQIWIVKMTR